MISRVEDHHFQAPNFSYYFICFWFLTVFISIKLIRTIFVWLFPNKHHHCATRWHGNGGANYSVEDDNNYMATEVQTTFTHKTFHSSRQLQFKNKNSGTICGRTIKVVSMLSTLLFLLLLLLLLLLLVTFILHSRYLFCLCVIYFTILGFLYLIGGGFKRA